VQVFERDSREQGLLVNFEQEQFVGGSLTADDLALTLSKVSQESAYPGQRWRLEFTAQDGSSCTVTIEFEHARHTLLEVQVAYGP